MRIEVEWADKKAVDTLSEMDAELDRISSLLADGLPSMATVARENGDVLCIVLGSINETLLAYVRSNGDPPYFVSLGDPTNDGVFSYLVYPNHDTEGLRRHLISYDRARNALREFVEMKVGLPTSVTWCEE